MAVDPACIGFPDEATMSCEDGLVENHHYRDLRDYDASDFDRLWEDEQELFDYVDGGGDLGSDEACDHFGEGGNEVYMLDLDPGVASTVIALAAIGACPVTCCNGAPGHFEQHPLVFFWGEAEHVAKVEAAAAKVEGVEVVGQSGGILAYTELDVNLMREFALVLMGRR